MKEKRMKSFVNRANVLANNEKQAEAAKLLNEGMKYYSNNVIRALSPYAASDAGVIAVVLRHLADEIEAKNAGAKELAKWLDEHTEKPVLVEKQKFKKPNMK